MGTARLISYAARCPHCGKATPKLIAWLTTKNSMACSHCGDVINCEGGDLGFHIQELSVLCARFDAGKKLD